MAELADALVLGTSGYPVQVQVLLSAVMKKAPIVPVLFVLHRFLFGVYLIKKVCSVLTGT